jgi:hypothetical protein
VTAVTTTSSYEQRRAVTMTVRVRVRVRVRFGFFVSGVRGFVPYTLGISGLPGLESTDGQWGGGKR